MEKQLSIALCQMMTIASKEGNLARAAWMIKQAADKGADLVVLPEVFNAPYQADLFPEYAETYPGPTTEFLSRMARENNILLAGGSIIEECQGKLYNSSFVFDEGGNLLGRHRKIHLFDVDMPGRITFKESDTLSPGHNLTLIKHRKAVFGLLICYDIRFPELARALALAGAELLILPAAFNHTSGPLFWELMMRSRAVDQQVYLAAAAPAFNPEAEYPAWGKSMIVDPWGQILAQADQQEELILANLDFSVNLQVRKEIPLLDHRRTDLYRLNYKRPKNIESTIEEDD